MEQGHFDEAIAECEAAVAVGRQNRAKYEDVAKAFVRMAKACLKKDDLDAALTALRQAQVCGYVGGWVWVCWHAFDGWTGCG